MSLGTVVGLGGGRGRGSCCSTGRGDLVHLQRVGIGGKQKKTEGLDYCCRHGGSGNV